MTSSKLTETYGKRFTPITRIVALIVIILFGILMSFKEGSAAPMERITTVELSASIA